MLSFTLRILKWMARQRTIESQFGKDTLYELVLRILRTSKHNSIDGRDRIHQCSFSGVCLVFSFASTMRSISEVIVLWIILETSELRDMLIRSCRWSIPNFSGSGRWYELSSACSALVNHWSCDVASWWVVAFGSLLATLSIGQPLLAWRGNRFCLLREENVNELEQAVRPCWL